MTIKIPLPPEARLVRIAGDTALFRDTQTHQLFTVRSSRLTAEQVRVAMLEARADYYEQSDEPIFPVGSVACAVAIIAPLGLAALVGVVIYLCR